MTIQRKWILFLITTLAVCSFITYGQPAESESSKKTPQVRFMRALDVKLVLAPNDPLAPQLCRQLSGRSRCPSILTGGWSAGGGIPMIEPSFQAKLPNVRVSFIVQDISNEVVAGGGVETTGAETAFVSWVTTSSAADVEVGGPFGWSLPGPGETWLDISHFGGGGGLLIYDALVTDACGDFSSFPVQHTATVERLNGDDLGQFQGTDNSTLDSTGFYNLSYTVRAEDGNGGVSDFHFSGKVNVTCSGLNSL